MSFGEPWFYIVILGAASILYAFILPGRKPAGASEAASDVEATLEQYMAEIEKENEELIDLVAGMKQELNSKQMSQQESIAELRQRLLEAEQLNRQLESRMGALENSASLTGLPASGPLATPSISDSSTQLTVAHLDNASLSTAEPEAADSMGAPVPEAAGEPEAEMPGAENSLRSRYPELFDLYEKGKSIDMIAKSIGIQRGEVQLILQLANREDA
ncbi:hypothetical protein MKX50_11105 [Paenibacillus sp. FSL W8-0186]|uniref:hypothetical protein n=1 Tax=Paenibacillus sp. FSL W8-0186 TaxID=2921709 RepID=UPI0030CF6455